MLAYLHISNLALVKNLQLDLSRGMTVLTGETGAGKSILIDAMNLALGARADANIIRTGEHRAEVALFFDIIDNPDVQNWLSQHELDTPEDECVLRRVIQQDARSRAFINDRPVPLQKLRELGQQLIEIHGQHGYQSLLNKDNHLQILDDYANTIELGLQVKRCYRKLHDTEQALHNLRASIEQRQDRMHYLQFQIDELTELALKEDEWQLLNQKHKQLSQAEHLIATADQVVNMLCDAESQNLLNSVQMVQRLVAQAKTIDDRFSALENYLSDALIQIEEASVEAKHIRQETALNPQELQQVELRISEIFDIARKHRTEPELLAQTLHNYQQEWHELNAHEESIESLTAELNQWQEQYHQLAKQLSAQRQKHAKILAKTITQHCRVLGMPQAEFKIDIKAEEQRCSTCGYDQIHCLIAPNPGIGFSELHKTASGGELSRISLAIELANQQVQSKPVLIFDEVDVGIGGSVAEVVGQCLHSLSQKAQVLCVTHLAQVAANADHHGFIAKKTEKKMTASTVTMLDKQQRIQELARMLGGVEITPKTLAHAEEMLS